MSQANTLLRVSTTPVLPQKRTRAAILERGREALLEAQEQSVFNGTSDMTLDEINGIIAECRQEGKRAYAQGGN
jgi:hypothetical protein